MKIGYLTLTLVIAAAATGCAAERTLAPQTAAPTVAAVSPAMTQVPLLYVVDGVRLQRDQVPALTGDEVASVQVVKGRQALRMYGPDASYGVVVITTKAALAPRT